MRWGKEYLEGRKVTVVGLARSGLAAANLLRGLGARVTATDVKGGEELRPYALNAHPEVKLELGGHTEESFLKAETIVLSPGVPWNQPLLARAKGLGVEIISEIELAARLTDVPIIAVTGTNGKSTTTVLIGEMLKASGKRASVGGNLGRPMVEMVQQEGVEYLVVEVSSYQLEGIVNFRPHIALMLNISPDHLERHGDMQGYMRAKKRIYMNMGLCDYLIVNADDGELAPFGQSSSVRRITFSTAADVEEGAFIKGKHLVVRLGGSEQQVINVDGIRIKGVHNLENALAAAAAATCCGAGPTAMREVLRNFRGLPHRLVPVRTVDGVLYVNDSKGTNVGAAVKALESFQPPVILIAGGKDKGGDYAPLMMAAQGKVKAAILLGESRDKMAGALSRAVKTIFVENMDEAVLVAHSMSASGDVVLLSPACSSFDMFRDYEERGEVFERAVRELSAGKVQA